jgi:hypothetical protein
MSARALEVPVPTKKTASPRPSRTRAAAAPRARTTRPTSPKRPRRPAPAAAGSWALVTGASGGIGLEIARLLAEQGHGLVLVARSADRLAEIAAELQAAHGTATHVIARDVAGGSAAFEVRDELARAGIAVDVLVNNAGFGLHGAFVEAEWDKQLQMMELNMVALTAFARAFGADMAERGRGRILNVASTAAFQPTPVMATYGSTKAFVLHWSLALREELRDAGVHVMAVCPGPTSSEFFKRAGLRKGTVSNSLSMSSDEVADEAYTALAHGRGQFVNGWKNWIAVVFSARIPKPLAAWVTARVLERYRRHRESA